MTWHSLTHGTTGLVLGGLTVLALIVTLIQQGTPARMMLASPIVALPCLFVGAVVAAVLAGPLVTGIPAAGADPVRASLLSLVDIAGGLLFARRHPLTETHKRGTVIQAAGQERQRAQPPDYRRIFIFLFSACRRPRRRSRL